MSQFLTGTGSKARVNGLLLPVEPKSPAQIAKARLRHIVRRDRILANGGQWHDVSVWNFKRGHMRRTLRWEWVR